jgi:HlyD family secretion protein
MREGLRAQLDERIAQLEEQIQGLTQQAQLFSENMALIRKELLGLEELFAKKYVTVTRLMELKREDTAVRGSHAQALAEIAQAKGKITETRLQILQIGEDLRTEVTGALSDLKEKMAELLEKKTTAYDQLTRVDLRAPADGLVHELSVHTVGGVIEAGSTLMMIVPDADDLSMEVKVEAQDRDQVRVGQSAVLRFSAFNQRSTPELKGIVDMVAADLVEEAQTGMRYYTVRIALLAGERERLGGERLSPGMPVESFVETGYRTVLSYLVKPLADYLALAFRAD